MLKNKMELLQSLKNDLQRNEDMLQAWENVEIVTKKDGKPYKSLDRNFVNASVENITLLRPNPCLTVNFETVFSDMSPNGYGSDSIQCTKQVNRQALETCGIDESRIIKESLIVPYYYLTVEEIQAEIEKRKNDIRHKIESLKKDINDFPALCDKIHPLLEQVQKIIDNENHRDGGRFKSNMYYLLIDYTRSEIENM